MSQFRIVAASALSVICGLGSFDGVKDCWLYPVGAERREGGRKGVTESRRPREFGAEDRI